MVMQINYLNFGKNNNCMEWIDINIQRPPLDERVIICRSGEVDTAYLSRSGWMWDMTHNVPDADEITHWMELPKPPNKPVTLRTFTQNR